MSTRMKNSRRIYLEKIEKETREAYCYDYARRILKDEISKHKYKLTFHWLDHKMHKECIAELEAAIKKLEQK